MNGIKEFNNTVYHGGDVEHGAPINGGSAPPSAPSPYQSGGEEFSRSSKLSPWVVAWIAFSTILGIVGLILGAYATAEVNSIPKHSDLLAREEFLASFNAKALTDMDGVFSLDPNKRVQGFSEGTNIVGDRGLWVSHPDLDLARSDGGAVSHNDMIYVFGGLRLRDPDATPPGEILNSLVRYDPKTRLHAELETMPDRRYRMGYAQMDGKIYVFGGLDKWDDRSADHSNPKSTLIYDIASNTWEDLGDTDNHMNVLRADACGAAANGKVYAFGGFEHQNNFTTSASIEEFDPATKQWREIDAKLGVARGDCKAVTVDNKVYVLGGAVETTGMQHGVNCSEPTKGDDWMKCYKFSTANERFDPSDGSVVEMAPMEVGRGDLGVAATPQGNIMVTGGETAAPSVDIFRELATDSVEEYSVMTDSWRPKTRLPKNKFRHGMATANGEIFVLGGHPTCSDGLVQCMEDALSSVTAFKSYLGILLRDRQQ